MGRRIARTQSTGVLWWLRRTLSWTIILGLMATVTAAVLVPRAAGATPYTILTGSMKPTMPPGTLVVVKPAPVTEIGVGTAITYQLVSGKPTVVTHRVVGAGLDGAGANVFTTKGDANNTVDAEPVRQGQIRGEVWYTVPYLGYVNEVITGQRRQTIMAVVVGCLVLYAALMFTTSARDRVRRRTGTPVTS